MRRLVFIALVAIMLSACGRGDEELPRVLTAILADTPAPNPYDKHADSAPDGGCIRLRSNIHVPLARLFNDSNHVHLAQARAGGIRPVEGAAMAWEEGRGLVEIKSNPYFYVDELRHSYPYLKPHAADLLMEIGRRFSDTLAARGGGAYRMKVTSLLRTPLSVGKLRRVNRNATGESAHQYATTFDISYSKFICDDPSQTHRTFEDLKNLLAEIVDGLRSEGRCLVKHERHQACFHITAIAPGVVADDGNHQQQE